MKYCKHDVPFENCTECSAFDRGLSVGSNRARESDAVSKLWDRDGPYGPEEYKVWASPDVWAKLEELRKDVACKHVSTEPDEPDTIFLCGHLDDSPLRPFLTKMALELNEVKIERDRLKAELSVLKGETKETGREHG